MNIRKTLLFMVVFVFFTISVAFGQWGQPSKSEVQEYIEIFVNVGLYAVPYSEPLSVLLSSPDIIRMNLHGWVANRHREAWDDYDDALDRGVRGESLVQLMERANRYQAIYSCLFQNDCTRLKQIEAKDIRERRQPDEKLKDLLGRVWIIKEGRRGDRTRLERIGSSNKFNADFSGIGKGTVTISVKHGNRVTLRRDQDPLPKDPVPDKWTRRKCTYTGTFSPDFRAASGTFNCNFFDYYGITHDLPWEATIKR